MIMPGSPFPTIWWARSAVCFRHGATLPRNRIHGARSRLMREFLEKQGCHVGQGIFIPERLAAARAGSITYGKNCFAFTPDSGSFIVLSSFVVDVDLDYDEPTYDMHCPPKCTACIDACPTGAIYEPLKMNPRRCIAFNTFWAQDSGSRVREPYPVRDQGKDGIVDPRLRHLPGGVPTESAQAEGETSPRSVSGEGGAGFRPHKTAAHDRGILPYAGSTAHVQLYSGEKILSPKCRYRLGNSGDRTYLPALERALQEPEALVRGTAAWAIGKIGGAQGREIIESALTRKHPTRSRKISGSPPFT